MYLSLITGVLMINFNKHGEFTLGDAITFNEMKPVKDFINYIDCNSNIKKAGFKITEKSPIQEVILYFQTVNEMIKRADKDKKLFGYVEYIDAYINRFNYIISLNKKLQQETERNKQYLQ